MKRINIIDNLRGIAFIFMIIQHIFYFYDVSKLYETSYAKIPFVDLSGTIARSLFIFLAGSSLVLNYKKNKEKFLKNKILRSIEILIHAVIISITTYIFYPDFFVRFGILHFISIATLLCSLIIDKPMIQPLLIILLLIIKPPKINNFVDTITGASVNYNMMDWFPLNKWLPLMILGMYFVENIDLTKINILNQKINLLSFLSQNSLNLYTFHIIFLIIIFTFINKKT
jgi:uncharacterized membrane protein